jgi:hypothetical protein
MLRLKLILQQCIVNFVSLTVVILLAFGLPLPIAAAAALPAGSEPESPVEQPDSQQQAPAEISIEAERQTALAKQAVIISETPDAGPQSKRLSVVVGLGASAGPAYGGSAVTRVTAIPYVDVRGLLGGRLYISDVNGLGLNLLDTGSFRWSQRG